MKEIMSAEEFFKSEIPKYESVSDFMTDGDIFYHAREFATMHVKYALEEASKLAIVKYVEEDGCATGDYYEVDKKSILNAYPLTNIK